MVAALPLRAQYLGGNADGYSGTSSVILALNDQSFYCTGGTRDGYSLQKFGPVLINDQAIYCSGGDKDGYDGQSYLAGAMYDQSAYCNGGDSGGYDRSYVIVGRFYLQSVYCSGGNRDGYGRADTLHGPLNDQFVYCSGGDSSGYDREYLGPALFFDQSLYCSGGIRDGYSRISLPLDSLGNGIWTGVVSTDWNTAGNWANNVVPTVNDLVYIPTGCVYYPYLTSGLSVNDVSQSHRCRSLEIQDGAELTTLNAPLSAYGRVIVGGTYTATNSINSAQTVFSGGNLQILNSGIVRFGNQSTGTAESDLTVNPGGVLDIEGGVLEVDDQFNIRGTFTMSGGYVFAHKFGSGSAVTAIAGPFNVTPGASGNVSGGIVRVCGKEGGTWPAIALNDPDFDFSGSSILLVTNGVSSARSDAAIKTVDGSTLQNLLVSKPGHTVTLSSDMVVNGQVYVTENASLKVAQGHRVSVGGGVMP